VRLVERPSPNHEARPGVPVDMLVLHYTGMQSAEAALERLCDPASKVSCHWLIDEDGTVYRLVDEARRAFHAGVSFWRGERDTNSRSIGIELVNPGHEWGYRPFPPAQMAALIDLATGIEGRHPIPAHQVLGHSDVAPRRKQDPGEKFDWTALAAAGLGIWPVKDARPAALDPIAGLTRIGYDVAGDGIEPVVTAFQRHWRPAGVDGAIDHVTALRIALVAAAV